LALRPHAVLAAVSRGYPPPPDTFLRVPHPSATDRPESLPVRLACVRHAASVRSEPGSNSQVQNPTTKHTPNPRRSNMHPATEYQTHQNPITSPNHHQHRQRHSNQAPPAYPFSTDANVNDPAPRHRSTANKPHSSSEQNNSQSAPHQTQGATSRRQ
jgi:hypothetical protein